MIMRQLSVTLLLAAVLLLRWFNGDWVSARMRCVVWGIVAGILLVPIHNGRVPFILRKTPVCGMLETWNTALSDNVPLMQGIVAVYLAGAVLAGGVLLWSNLRFAAVLRRTRRPAAIAGAHYPTYVCDRVDSPCVYGLFRPCVYVTEAVLADETLLRYTMLHEETHCRRLDHLWSLLRCVCLVLYWYHPLVWLGAYLSKVDSELACDECVVGIIGYQNRFDYGRALIAITCGLCRTMPLAAVTMIGSECIVKRRVQRIAAEDYSSFEEALFTVGFLFMILLWTYF